MNVNLEIEDLIKETFKILVKTPITKNGICHIGGERIIYPEKRGAPRVSEQELKQVFIRVLNEELNKKDSPLEDFYFSVETPTKNKYSFSEDNIEVADAGEPETDRSALVDLSLYQRIDEKCNIYSHIEFKARNPKEKNIQKDLLKLFSEKVSGDQSYFIHIVQEADKGTYKSLLKKYSFDSNIYKEPKTKVSIYLLVLNDKIDKKPSAFVIKDVQNCDKLNKLDL